MGKERNKESHKDLQGYMHCSCTLSVQGGQDREGRRQVTREKSVYENRLQERTKERGKPIAGTSIERGRKKEPVDGGIS